MTTDVTGNDMNLFGSVPVSNFSKKFLGSRRKLQLKLKTEDAIDALQKIQTAFDFIFNLYMKKK